MDKMTKSARVEFDGISYISKIDLQKNTEGIGEKFHCIYTYFIGLKFPKVRERSTNPMRQVKECRELNVDILVFLYLSFRETSCGKFF